MEAAAAVPTTAPTQPTGATSTSGKDKDPFGAVTTDGALVGNLESGATAAATAAEGLSSATAAAATTTTTAQTTTTTAQTTTTATATTPEFAKKNPIKILKSKSGVALGTLTMADAPKVG